jgi:hypothetical protein
MHKETHTFEEIAGLLEYCPHTGGLRWKTYRPGQRGDGIAGSLCSSGYVRTVLGGRRYSNHRLAWLITFKEWPQGCIDHIDGNPANNRLNNLRLATHAENSRNRKVSTVNKTGVSGVSVLKSGKWVAHLYRNRKAIYLGKYPTKEKAIEARKRAEREHYKDFARK